MRVFLEWRRRLFSQTSARQMLHPKDRRSGTGDAFWCAADAETWSHDAFVSKRSKNQKGDLQRIGLPRAAQLQCRRSGGIAASALVAERREFGDVLLSQQHLSTALQVSLRLSRSNVVARVNRLFR